MATPAYYRFAVWPVMFAQYFALGLLRPEMPGILMELFDHQMSTVALYQGSMDAIGALVAFIFVPWIGDFSDQYGRKPALLLSSICSAAPVIVLTAYTRIMGAWITILLYACVSLVSKVNSYSVALSYVADCSSLEDRSSAFGQVSAMMFLGLTGGPLASEYLDRSTTLLAGTVLNMAACVYIICLLPETRSSVYDGDAADDQQTLLHSSPSTYGSFATSIPTKPLPTEARVREKLHKKSSIFLAWNFLTADRFSMLLGLITLVSQFAVFGIGQIYYLYLTEELAFQRQDLVHAALISGVETTGIMLLVMPALSRRIHESLLMLLGLCSYVVYAIGLSLSATSKVQAFSLIIFWAISGMTYPATCSLLSAHSPANSIGLAQGALSAIKCCASGLGPALFAVFFSGMVRLKHNRVGSHHPVAFNEDDATVMDGIVTIHYIALPFLLGAALILVTVVLTTYVLSPEGSATGRNLTKRDDVSANCVLLHHHAAAVPGQSKENHSHTTSIGTHDVHHGIGGLHLEFVELNHPHHVSHLDRVVAVCDNECQITDSEHQTAHPSGTQGVAVAPSCSSQSRWVCLVVATIFMALALAFIAIIGHLFPVHPNSNGHLRPGRAAAGTHMYGFNGFHASLSARETTAVENSNDSVALSNNSNLDLMVNNVPLVVMSLMGPPGVGKSAISRHLNAAYGFVPVSSGVLIRDEIQRATDLGHSIKSIVEGGGLISDEIVLKLVAGELHRLRVADPNCTGVILDGFPRTVAQARLLDSNTSNIPPLDPMIFLHMNDSILAKRRDGRRICPKCGRTYNLRPIDEGGYLLPARRPNHTDQTTCDADDTKLIRREDDEPAIAARRMMVFRNDSLPMAEYYYTHGDRLLSIEKTFSSTWVFLSLRPLIDQHLERQSQAARVWQSIQHTSSHQGDNQYIETTSEPGAKSNRHGTRQRVGYIG